MVRKQPGGYLHGDIAVKIECGQIAQRSGAEGEIEHQLSGHHTGSDALVKSDQIEQCAETPHHPGEAQRGIFSALRHGILLTVPIRVSV